jgi:hypothetical protein
MRLRNVQSLHDGIAACGGDHRKRLAEARRAESGEPRAVRMTSAPASASATASACPIPRAAPVTRAVLLSSAKLGVLIELSGCRGGQVRGGPED